MCDNSPITFLLPLSDSNQCYVCLYRYVMLVRSFLLFSKETCLCLLYRERMYGMNVLMALSFLLLFSWFSFPIRTIPNS